jgi:hypothetical protein
VKDQTPKSVAIVTPGAPADYDPMKHAYVRKQLRLIEEGKLSIQPGELAHVDVLHDDWCAMLTGTGLYCNCDPDIRLRGKV